MTIEHRWDRFHYPPSLGPAMLALLLLGLASCTTRCGTFVYCDVPESWPLTNTFTVESSTHRLCIGDAHSDSCASKGMFPAGTRAVNVRLITEDDEDTDSSLLATITLTGVAGDEFTAHCFAYNGRRVLGLSEVLFGVDIQLRGTVVATYPTHRITRRQTLFGC